MPHSEKCRDCNGFGYTKGSARGPWDKLDCDPCNGKGTIEVTCPASCCHPLPEESKSLNSSGTVTKERQGATYARESQT